jgi:hypothetical protein
MDCIDYLSSNANSDNNKLLSTRVVLGLHDRQTWDSLIRKQLQEINEPSQKQQAAVAAALATAGVTAAAPTQSQSTSLMNIHNHNLLIQTCKTESTIASSKLKLGCKIIAFEFSFELFNRQQGKHKKK